MLSKVALKPANEIGFIYQIKSSIKHCNIFCLY